MLRLVTRHKAGYRRSLGPAKSHTAQRRPLKIESLEERRLLAIDLSFASGLLTVTSDADDDIGVTAAGDVVQIVSSEPRAQNVVTADISQLNVRTNASTATIDITGVTRERFPNIQQAIFEGGPWLDVERTQGIIGEILGPGWAQNLGIADPVEFLKSGTWKAPLADGSLAAQLTDAGWGNAQELLDQIVSQVGSRAVVRSFSWGASEGGPPFGLLFNGHYDRTFAVKLSPAAAAAALADDAPSADINGNGIVGAADYTLWANAFGQTGDKLPADLNGDRLVNEADYDRLVAEWGTTGELSAAALADDVRSADINANGIVDAADYTLWANAYGQTGDDLAADLNGDGLVNHADYDVLVAKWGLLEELSGEFRQFRGAAAEGGPPGIMISDPTVNETDGTATFNVTLNRSSADEIRVDWSTESDMAFSPDDFTEDSGQLVFDPGQSSKPVTITIIDDIWDEADETFFVQLSNAVNAVLVESQGVGTILDDDPEPTISIGNIIVDEGAGAAVFTVSLSEVSLNVITVDWSTADGTAISPLDYAGNSDQITFWATLTAVQVIVPIVNDSSVESSETFTVNLSNPVGATIVDNQGLATILDNDPEPVVPAISIENVTVSESQIEHTLSVTLSEPTSVEVRVDWTTEAGSAVSGGVGPDFFAGSGQLVFTPGQITQEICFTAVDDFLTEDDETYFVRLSNPIAATLADAEGIVTIVEGDFPGISINSITVTEGHIGGSVYTLTVVLTHPSPYGATIHYTTVDGTAMAGYDYTFASDGFIFNPLDVEKEIEIEILGDFDPEQDEFFAVSLVSPVFLYIQDYQGTVVILDDDGGGGGLPDLTVDIDTDSDNDGTITALDDPIEADPAYPGRMIAIDEDDPDNLDLAHVQLNFDPGSVSAAELANYTITLDAFYHNDNILVWDSPTRDQLIPISPSGKTWSADQFPSTLDVYVEAVDHVQPLTLNLVVRQLFPSAGTAGIEIQRDEVRLTTVRANMTAYRPQTEAYDQPFRRRAVPANEEEHADHGVFIRRNGDDDDNDQIADRVDPVVAGDNDLVEVELRAAAALGAGIEFVVRRDNNNIRVWDSPDKDTEILNDQPINFGGQSTHSVWVEWVSLGPGDTSATLEGRLLDAANNTRLVDRLVFHPFQSVVIALGGRNQIPTDPAHANHGTFVTAIDLYGEGYDVHMYDEDVVATTSGAGQAYNEIVSAIQDRGVTNVAIFGYSYGGGSTHNLARRLNDNRAAIGNFTVQFTAYVDAVVDGGVSQQTQRPPGSAWHLNIYQPNGFAELGGGPMGTKANKNIDVTMAPPAGFGLNEDHYTIDDALQVKTEVKDRLKERVPNR